MHSRFPGLLGRASALLCATALFGCGSSEEPGSLVVVSFGGAYQKAQSAAYMKPFEKATGTHVTEGDYNGEYALLEQRATADPGTWDVVSVESGPCARGARAGLFAPIPDSVVAGLDLLPGARKPAAVAHLVFSTVLAFDTRAFASSSRPTSWADFWDLKRFPGKRALRNNPRGTLEIALLASGVDPAKLYPLDVERALSKLSEIRDDLVFWDSGAQPPQLLSNRTVAMSSVYNGRVWNAKVKEQVPVDWIWHGGLLEMEYWAVPKNAPHKQAAFDFIRFSLDRDRQVAFADAIAYGPTSRGATALVSPEVKSALPTQEAALPLQVTVDAEWWAANEAAVAAKWERWMGGR